MKAKLIFDLPEDIAEFEQCTKAGDYHIVLWELTHNVKRSLIKYQDNTEDFDKGVEAVFEKIYELLDEYNIKLD